MPKHFLTINDLNKNEIETILDYAKIVEQNWEEPKHPNNKCIASFFAEPSTRTRFSFERAMHWLGGKIITAADASTSSSLTKGESLKDTFRTLGQYADAIVMRHKDENWPEEARKYSRVPVINAGSGPGEHPTQALLDLHTIRNKFSDLNGLKVMMCGDLKNGRTVHSLASLLSLYGNKIYLCPSRTKQPNYQLGMPEKYNSSEYTEVDVKDVNDILPEIDVIYMTRLQKERFLMTESGVYDIEFFKLNNANIGKVKDSAIILHPLPRNEEISEEIDDDPRATYHERQVRNGVYVRVALLDYLLYKE
jgi:aspartate carbamoyltransferase catalytic subunit